MNGIILFASNAAPNRVEEKFLPLAVGTGSPNSMFAGSNERLGCRIPAS
jgi:hypothetical protein